MTTAPSTFVISAIPRDVLHQVRTDRTDASGNPVAAVVAGGGEPLRCCLCNARPGEHLLLFGYEPPLPPSPYREVGAVFAHAEPCPGPGPGPGDTGPYPPDWRGRSQVLRAYDGRGWLTDARVHDGSVPEAVIQEMFDDPAVVELHSRNVAYGCYMFRVIRA